MYTRSWGRGVRLSAPSDVKYAIILLSTLNFGANHLYILYGCDSPVAVTAECEITADTPNIQIQTGLTLDGTSLNSHALVMVGEPLGSSNTRNVYFLDPVTFGLGDFVRSDRSEQVTHVELTVWTVAGASQKAAKIAYRDRISLDTEGNWTVTEQYYCRALVLQRRVMC